MSRMLGEAFVTIRPTAPGFRTQAESEVKKQLAGMNPAIPLSADTGKAIAAGKAAQRYLSSLNANMKLGLDESGLAAKIAAVQAAMKALGSFGIGTTLDTRSTLAKLAMIQAAIKNVKGADVALGVTPAGAMNLAAMNVGMQEYIKNANQASGATLGLAASQQTLGRSARNATSGTGLAASAMGAFVQQAGNWGGALGALQNKVVLFSGVLDHLLPAAFTRASWWHIIADGFVEIAAVVIPATIALAAWGAVAAPVIQDTALRFKAIQTAASATSSSLGIFNYSVGGTQGAFQKLQNSVNPAVWEITGDAIRVVTARTGTFGDIVHSVNSVLINLAARMTQAFSSPQAGDFMKNAAKDVQGLGNVIGNIGGIIGNLIKDVPGYANVLLNLADKFTAIAETATRIAAPVIRAGLAIHGFFLYTGLAVTAGTALIAWAGRAATSLFTFASRAAGAASAGGAIARSWSSAGTAAKNFGSQLVTLATSPWTWAVVGAAAITFLTVKMLTASDTAKSFINNLNQNINTQPASTAIFSISTAIASLDSQIRTANASYTNSKFLGLNQAINIKDNAAAMSHFSNAWHDLAGSIGNVTKIGGAVNNLFDGWMSRVRGIFGGQAAVNNIKAFTGEIVHLTGEQNNLLKMTGEVMSGQTGATKTTYNFSQALGILDAAGVQANDSFSTMSTKVQGLLTSWQNLGIAGGQLGNAVNALSLQQEIQQTKVGQLTQAYSQFIGVVTGGMNAFITFAQGQNTLGQALNKASAGSVQFNNRLGTLSVRGTAAGASMNGLKQSSLSVAQGFLQQVSNASNLYNQLQTLAVVSAGGAKAQRSLTQAGKDMVAQLLPMAKGSSWARDQLYALAQVAGYQGPDSFKALSKWVGNSKNSEHDLQVQTINLTKASANLKQDVINLAGAIQQQLTQAMGAAIFQARGGQKAFDNFANAVLNSHGNLNSMQPSADKVIQQLKGLGLNSSQAHDQFDAFAGMLGITKSQADKLWNNFSGAGHSSMNSTSNDAKIMKQHFLDLYLQHHANTQQAHELWNMLSQNSMTTTGAQSDILKGRFEKLAEKIGLSKQQADNLWSSLKKLPANVSTNIKDTVSGSGKVTATATGFGGGMFGHILFKAAGGKIPGFGGGDSRLAMLEPGELVIPKGHASEFASAAKRKGIPGFASGGVAGGIAGLSQVQSELGDLIPWTNHMSTQFAQSAMAAFIKSASNALTSGGGGNLPFKSGGNYAGLVAAALKLLNMPMSLEGNFLHQIQTESGGNLYAVNHTDINAQHGTPSTGILQLIKPTYEAYVPGNLRSIGPFLNGVSINPWVQIVTALRYARSAYGSAIGHVIGFGHGYAMGGNIREPIQGFGLKTGQPYSFGEGGRIERYNPGGGGPGGGSGGGSLNSGDIEIMKRLDVLISVARQSPQQYGRQLAGNVGPALINGTLGIPR